MERTRTHSPNTRVMQFALLHTRRATVGKTEQQPLAGGQGSRWNSPVLLVGVGTGDPHTEPIGSSL